MFFDILLLSVIVVTAYLGPMLLRRAGPDQRTYGWMLIANLAAALIALIASKSGEGAPQFADMLGFIAVAAFVFLIMVPPGLRNAAHWAFRTDRLGIAMRLAGLREVLQPGMGAAREQDHYRSMIAVRAGRIDEAVEKLRERKAESSEPLHRRQLEERIVMTYLYGRRWTDAIDAYEILEGAPAPTSPTTVAEMVWAYCEAGDLEKAAELIERLEGSPLASEPLFAPFLHRSRMVFLAFVGRTAAVDAIVAPGGLLGPAMPEAVRNYWSGVARLRAGDRPGARKWLGEAAKRSGRNQRVRELAEARLDAVDAPGVAGPHALPSAVAELADRLAELASMPVDDDAMPAPHIAAMGRTPTPATFVIVAINVLVMGVLWKIYGATDSAAALTRTANTLTGVWVGEWWRMPTSVFVHVGLLHLFLNMYGLWVLGRFVERMFGTVRFAAIYMVAGVVGAVASHYFSAAPVSAGASGAVLGLAGALLAELWVHRADYPARWRSGLFRVLLFLTAANVAIGFAYPAIDQGAHIGGLVTGGVMALWLSRRLSFAGALAIRIAAIAITVVAVGATAYGAFMVTTTSYADTVAKYPVAERELGGLAVTAPSLWAIDGGELVDRSHPNIRFNLWLKPAEWPLDAALETIAEQEREAAPARGASHVESTRTVVLSLPEPWASTELRIAVTGPGGDEYYRTAVFGRVAGDGTQLWLGVATFPEQLAEDLSPIFASALSSVRPAK